MSPRGITGSVLTASVTGVLLVPLGAPAQAAGVDLAARMHPTTGFSNARGHAEYESDRHGREFDIAVAGVGGLAGRRLTVRVRGVLVGSMRVGSGGRAHLERHSGVPRMSAGDVVRVRMPGGRLVTYGTLHRHSD